MPGETITITTEKNPEAIAAAIKSLMLEQAKLVGKVTPESGQAALGGTGNVDVRPNADGSVGLGLEFFGGWILTTLNIAQASHVAASLSGTVAATLIAAQTKQAAEAGNITVQ